MHCQNLENGTFTIKKLRVWKNSSIYLGTTYDDLFGILFFSRYIISTDL